MTCFCLDIGLKENCNVTEREDGFGNNRKVSGYLLHELGDSRLREKLLSRMTALFFGSFGSPFPQIKSVGRRYLRRSSHHQLYFNSLSISQRGEPLGCTHACWSQHNRDARISSMF